MPHLPGIAQRRLLPTGPNRGSHRVPGKEVKQGETHSVADRVNFVTATVAPTAQRRPPTAPKCGTPGKNRSTAIAGLSSWGGWAARVNLVDRTVREVKNRCKPAGITYD